MRLDQFFRTVTVWTYCGAYRCGQFIPGTWSRNRKSLSLHRCRPTAWNYQAELFSRSQATTSMHCGDKNTEFLQVWRCPVVDGVRNEQQSLESRPLCCWQPVKIVSNQTRNRMESRDSKNQTCCSVENSLNSIGLRNSDTRQYGVTVVYPSDNEWMDESSM